MRSASAAEVSPIRGRSSKTSTVPSTSSSSPTTPVVGWICAASSCSSVVLPAPFGPRTTQRSLSSTVQLDVVEQDRPASDDAHPGEIDDCGHVGDPTGRNARGRPVTRPRTVSAVDAPLPPGCRLSLRLVVNLNADPARASSPPSARPPRSSVPTSPTTSSTPTACSAWTRSGRPTSTTGSRRLLAAEPDRWLLALPVPGALGPLRGPVELNTAALAAGEAAVASSGGVALVPHRVGQAVQWRVHAAARPFAPPTLYEAERAAQRGRAAGRHHADPPRRRRRAPGPRADHGAALAPGYPPRARLAADRAARLLAACDEALTTDGAAITLHEAEVRSRELRVVRTAAGQALCAAAGWPEV